LSRLIGLHSPDSSGNKVQIMEEEVAASNDNLHQAQAPTVLDHSRTLPQGARPAFTRRAVGGECNLIILDAGDVLHDAFAVKGPLDAEPWRGNLVVIVGRQHLSDRMS
jgi:hypothetical protein